VKYLLDTNACIAHLRGRESGVTARLRALAPGDAAVCSVVKSELLFGARRSRDPDRERAVVDVFLAPFVSLPFDDAAAERYSEVRHHLERAGLGIGAYDLQIAAIALSNGLTLITHNTGEFSRVPGLTWEDWQVPP
jgi:tRNA(fMet)-specific endonuclease VapC